MQFVVIETLHNFLKRFAMFISNGMKIYHVEALTPHWLEAMALIYQETIDTSLKQTNTHSGKKKNLVVFSFAAAQTVKPRTHVIAIKSDQTQLPRTT